MATPLGYNAHEQGVIESALAGAAGWRAMFVDMVPSTQDAVRTLARDGHAEHLVVVASHQTAARGRQGKVWHQDPGQDISVSLLLEPCGRYPNVLLPMLLAAAVHRCLADHLDGKPHRLRVKWPNDVLVDERKIAGTLIEAEGDRHWIAGIGLNVNRLEFPREIEDRATSLTLVTGGYEERATVLAGLLRTIVKLVTAAEAGDLEPALQGFATALQLVGQSVVVQTGDGSHCGVLESIAPEAIVVDGTRFAPGEVQSIVSSGV